MHSQWAIYFIKAYIENFKTMYIYTQFLPIEKDDWKFYSKSLEGHHCAYKEHLIAKTKTW